MQVIMIMRKNALRVIAFLLILFIVLSRISSVLCFKYRDGISQLSTFYQLDDNTVDVLILGSSHAYVNFNNGTLWDEYGMASFNLGGSIQPMWNTYHYLVEAYKTQTPQLIVLDAYALTNSEEYSDDARIIKNTYGLKWSKNKLDAIIASAPKENLWNYLLEYRQFHTRYADLNRGDYVLNEDILIDTSGKTHYREWKGQDLMNTSVPQTMPNVKGVTDKESIPEKQERYFRKIIELTKKNDTPLIVVVTPYTLSEKAQKIYNRAGEISEEYGIPFYNLNLNIEEIGIDFQTDYSDFEHLNCEGSRKFSLYFGDYLKQNYNLSDRRGNSKYSSWQRNADYTRRYCQGYRLLLDNDIDALERDLIDDNYILIVAQNGTYEDADGRINRFLQTIGAKGLEDVELITRNNEPLYNSLDGQTFLLDDHEFTILKTSVSRLNVLGNVIVVDAIPMQAVNNGWNIVVYDRTLKTVIDCIGIDGTDHSITHLEEMNTW